MGAAPTGRWTGVRRLMAGAALGLIAWPVAAQHLAGDALIEALQHGGYVLVMRNARSQAEPPPEGQRAPGNLQGERQIDETGQGQMAALGYAFRELHVPIGQALTSPAYRARQSAHYLGFGARTSVDALAPASEGGDPAWLKTRVTQMPPAGENTLIVTHGSVIADSFGEAASGLDTAEMLVFRPADDEVALVARLTVKDWADMAVK